MNCTDFEQAVQQELDARRTELSADLQSHHDTCADCRLFYAAQLAFVSVTKMWQSTTVAPPEIIEAVLTQAAAAPSKSQVTVATKSGSPGRFWGAIFSAAAMVMIAVTLLQAPPPAQQPVAQREAPSPVESGVVSDTLTGLLHGMSADYVALPTETQRALQNFSELPDSAPLLQEFSGPEPLKMERPVEWQRWDRPVSDRVGQAFGFLWEALPQTSERSS